MKVIRCKDCVLANTKECPITYTEKIKNKEMFYCGLAKAKADYKPTRGDIVRDMTDAQIGEMIASHEKEGYMFGLEDGKKFCTTANKKFWRGYMAEPPEADDEEI